MNLAERKDTTTGKPLGIVDAQGVSRFVSDDINECRDFLRGLGLSIPYHGSGWRREAKWNAHTKRNEPGWLGLIAFDDGKWCAAAWVESRIYYRHGEFFYVNNSR